MGQTSAKSKSRSPINQDEIVRKIKEFQKEVNSVHLLRDKNSYFLLIGEEHGITSSPMLLKQLDELTGHCNIQTMMYIEASLDLNRYFTKDTKTKKPALAAFCYDSGWLKLQTKQTQHMLQRLTFEGFRQAKRCPNFHVRAVDTRTVGFLQTTRENADNEEYLRRMTPLLFGDVIETQRGFTRAIVDETRKSFPRFDRLFKTIDAQMEETYQNFCLGRAKDHNEAEHWGVVLVDLYVASLYVANQSEFTLQVYYGGDNHVYNQIKFLKFLMPKIRAVYTNK